MSDVVETGPEVIRADQLELSRFRLEQAELTLMAILVWATTLIQHRRVRSFGRSREILTGSSTRRFELLSWATSEVAGQPPQFLFSF